MNINLINAVVEQLGHSATDVATFKGDAESYLYTSLDGIYNHGISGGYTGFVCYSETVAFYNAHAELIKAYYTEQAEELGLGGFYSLVSTFNCAGGLSVDAVVEALNTSDSDDETTIKNCLSWGIAEEVARYLMEQD